MSIKIKEISVPRFRLLNKIKEGHFVFAATFSKDGRTFACGGSDDKVKLCDVETGKVRASFEEHTEYVLCISISPDGKRIASGSRDCRLYVWDTVLKEVMYSFEAQNHMTAVCFSPDSSMIVACFTSAQYFGFKAALISVEKGEIIHILSDCSRIDFACHSITFSPDGNLVAMGSFKTLTLWDISTKKHQQYVVHKKLVESVSFSEDGKKLASIDDSGLTKLWDVESRTCTHTFNCYDGVEKLNFVNVSFYPDGSMLATSAGKNIKIWSISSTVCEEILCITEHDDEVTCLEFSNDGSMLISGSWDKTINIFNVDF